MKNLLTTLLLCLTLGGSLRASELVAASASDLNGVHGGTPLVAGGGRLFACYIDDQLRVMIADREISSTEWRHSVVDQLSADDAHNSCAIGVDAQGFLHAAYDMHSSPPKAARSTSPLDPTSFLPESIPVGSSTITYPLFVRSGANLFMFYRTGSAGAGDECLAKLDGTGSWSIVACPMIAGAPLSSPYLAPPRVDSLGRLHVLWTNRSGHFNYGLFSAIYDPATGTFSDGSGALLTVPLPGEEVLAPAYRVSNAGLNILPEVDGRTIAAYLREVGLTFEVFTASQEPGTTAWSHSQLTNERAPRLRACPTGTDTVEPRSCDMELLSPALLRLSPEDLVLVYGRSVATPRTGTWSRPAARTMMSRSMDGISWSEPEEAHWLPAYSEQSEESGGLPLLLAQDATEQYGPLYLWDALDLSWGKPPAETVLRLSGSGPVEMSDTATWPSSFSLHFELRPKSWTAPMGLLDKSWLAGDRELRVVLWGFAPPGGSFGFAADRIQVAIGNSAGDWGLIWYPTVQISPQTWSLLDIEWDGQVVAVYLAGVKVDEIAYAETLKDTANKLVVGGVRSGSGALVRPYYGDLHFAARER